MFDFRKAVARATGTVVVPFMVTFSGTYLYPILGIPYFLWHPTLWSSFCRVLLPEIMLFVFMYFMFYIFLYPPQAVLALFFNGPSGIITAWIAILHESTVAAHLLAEATVLPTPLRGVFDSVMTREGFDDLVVRGRLRRAVRPTFFSRLKVSLKNAPKNILFPAWILTCLVKISLHFVPVVGPVLLVLMDGPKHARRCHRRYFELKGFDQLKEEQYVRDHRGQYLGFGMVSAALESLPVIGLFFAFTNTTGAALWAVNAERRILSANRQLAAVPKGGGPNDGTAEDKGGDSANSLASAKFEVARTTSRSLQKQQPVPIVTATRTRPDILDIVIPKDGLRHWP